MALTPDDVVTKQFQHVRFKEGFDPDEVDDYLDEIVVEWRKALEENEQLKAKIAALEAGDAAPAAPAAPVAEAAPVVEEKPAEEAAPVSSTATSAASIIERAQRLHDEHVAEGQAKAEAILAEAQVVVGDARTQAGQIVAEAEAKQREITAKLDSERKTLEGRITELRQFERDYRQQLRNYFESKLKDLDTTGGSAGSTPVSAIGL